MDYRPQQCREPLSRRTSEPPTCEIFLEHRSLPLTEASCEVRFKELRKSTNQARGWGPERKPHAEHLHLLVLNAPETTKASIQRSNYNLETCKSLGEPASTAEAMATAPTPKAKESKVKKTPKVGVGGLGFCLRGLGERGGDVGFRSFGIRADV